MAELSNYYATISADVQDISYRLFLSFSLSLSFSPQITSRDFRIIVSRPRDISLLFSRQFATATFAKLSASRAEIKVGIELRALAWNWLELRLIKD